MGKTLQNLDAVQCFFHDEIIHLENISDIPYIKKGFIKVCNDKKKTVINTIQPEIKVLLGSYQLVKQNS